MTISGQTGTGTYVQPAVWPVEIKWSSDDPGSGASSKVSAVNAKELRQFAGPVFDSASKIFSAWFEAQLQYSFQTPEIYDHNGQKLNLRSGVPLDRLPKKTGLGYQQIANFHANPGIYYKHGIPATQKVFPHRNEPRYRTARHIISA